ncbi:MULTISPECIES: O-antigen ligase family protein [Methylococcus]|uniref:O-antigen ligase family protein n=1 Tax=Methylococcus capsulatus TaxID=414 RepID=A0ABZ2F1K5_METCP|nr:MULTISPECIES: O-antigen ligase family protein [Methylococcus]MDF9392786.1 O-antigen ligase domain-containing protein [Methylococcus capsulatus]
MKLFPLYNIAFSAGLASTAYVFAIMGGGDNPIALLVVQAIVLLLPGLSLFTKGYKRVDRRNITFLVVLSIGLLLSLIVNIDNYAGGSIGLDFVLAHIVGIVGMLFAIQWAVTNLSPETLMRYLAIFLVPLIVLAIGVALQEGGWTSRAAPFDIHPNWWGELGFAFTACTLALHSNKAKVLLIGVAMVLFFLVQSRGALLATCVCIGVYIFFSIKHMIMKKTTLLRIIAAIIGTGAALATQQDAVLQAWAFIKGNVLLLDNSYRGVESGLSGRVDGWSRALSIFAENPIFGQGIDTLNEVHNGFLRLAGEGGMLLLLVILFMIGITFYQSLKKRNYMVASIILGYIVYVMTYPRMLNMNLASAIFYLCLFYWPNNHNKIEQRIHKHPEKAVYWQAINSVH